MEDKIIALSLFLNISDTDEILETVQTYTYNNEEYYVLTDEEADEKQDEYLDYYISDLLDIPDSLINYFDTDKWKYDVTEYDGRGHYLSAYDGVENEQEYNGETYYIYRIN